MELTAAEALGDGGSWTAAVAASAEQEEVPRVPELGQEQQLEQQPEHQAAHQMESMPEMMPQHLPMPGPVPLQLQLPESKICRLCTLDKPSSAFKRARSHDGLMHICMLCQQVSYP